MSDETQIDKDSKRQLEAFQEKWEDSEIKANAIGEYLWDRDDDELKEMERIGR